MSAMRARLALVFLSAATVGCREVASRVFTQPTVQFQSVKLGAVGLNGATVNVAIRIINPNAYALTAKSARYQLLAGENVKVGEGSVTQAVTVAAHDTVVVSLPVSTTWDALGRAGGTLVGSGTVNYTLQGDVIADTPIGDRTIPLRSTGTFAPLNRLR